MKVLVTGSSGWLGRHLSPLLVERGWRPHGLDVVAGDHTDTIASVADRAAVDRLFANHAFDAVPDNDNIGVQPSWLPDSDQSGPQITTLEPPLPIGVATLSLAHHASNGGGTFDVTVRFRSGASLTTVVQSNDWFGGDIASSEFVDTAQISGPPAMLNVQEAVIDLAGFAGDAITAIEFGNRSNPSAGHAIYGARIDQFESFGSGCGAPTPLALAPQTSAILGADLALQITAIPATAVFGAFAFGNVQRSQDLTPIGAPGCFQLLDIVTTFPFAPASASADLVLPLPFTPELAGLPLVFQAAVLDPTSNALGVATSNGIRTRVR